MGKNIVLIGSGNRTYHARRILRQKHPVEINYILPKGKGFSRTLNPDEIDVILILEGKKQGYGGELDESLSTPIPVYVVSNSSTIRQGAKDDGAKEVYSATEFYSRGGIEKVISEHLTGPRKKRESEDPLIGHAKVLARRLKSKSHKQSLMRRATKLQMGRNENAYELLDRYYKTLESLESAQE